MKRASFLALGLLTTFLFFAPACGSDGATATPRPRVTNTPTILQEPTPTLATAATAVAELVETTSSAEVSLEIVAGGDALEFDTSRFFVDVGSQVTLTFDNVSTINQHNWVLVVHGSKDDVSQRGTSHPTTDWIQPEDPDVIANTKVLEPGAIGRVTFAAPPPGSYQFVCTFPGHNFTMFGDFIVN